MTFRDGTTTAASNPPHRLEWDTVIDRHKAIPYDGDRRVTR
jgi:hypothetical protein